MKANTRFHTYWTLKKKGGNGKDTTLPETMFP